MNARERRVERAQTRTVFKVPFFAPGVMSLPVTFDDTVETAETDGDGIRWNPAFFDSLTDDQLVTVLCHETCHCLYGHIWRAPAGCDWDLWNKACDHAVNLILKDFSAVVMGKKLADPFPFPPPPDAYLANPAFSGMAEEKIYAILASQQGNGGQPGKQPQGQGAGHPQKPAPGKGQGQGQGKTQAPGQPQPKPEPGSMPKFGQMKKPSGPKAEAAERKKDATKWDEKMIQAVAIGKGRGDLPGGVSRYVDDMLKPKVPWYELVRQWLLEHANDDWNWMKPNTYFDESDFILPSLDNERTGAIVFATDTSGSIDQDALRRFQTEKQNCLDQIAPEMLTDIYCDTRIHKIAEYRPGDKIDRDAPGGGGTSFVDVFDYADKLNKPPRCLVYLTDLDGTFPSKAPSYPVLWVVYGGGTDKKAPFGETVPIGNESA